MFTIIGILLTSGIGSTVRAATFTEVDDAGELIPDAQGPVTIPQFDTIEGTLIDGGEIDLYQLQLDFDGNFTIVSLDLADLGQLFLFDEMGRGLGTGLNELSFSGVAGEIFYLGINGVVALNELGLPILDPSMPDFIGSGFLTSWEGLMVVPPAIFPYEISLIPTSQSVPDPHSSLALLTFGTLGLGSTLKHKLKLSKSSKKVICN